MHGSKCVVHGCWNSELPLVAGQEYEYDIALVHLDQPMTELPVVALLGNELDTSWIDAEVTYVGYGFTENLGGGGGGKGSGIQRYVQQFVDDITSYSIRSIDSNKGTCQGDSGGPGMSVQGGAYQQLSVTSNGSVPCGTGRSESTRVDVYTDWIEHYTFPDVPSYQPAGIPRFRCSHVLDPEEVESVALTTLADPNLKCIVDYPNPEKITEVNWFWGDGESLTRTAAADGADVLVADHAYTAAGAFSVRMCADYLAGDPPNEVPATYCAERPYFAVVCGEPDAKFFVESVDTNELRFVNQTEYFSEACVSGIQWDIYQGNSATGEPIDSIVSWSPTYQFPDGGNYTVVLNVGGIGGTGAASLVVNVGKLSSSSGCATGGTAPVSGAAAGLLLLALRRRSR
jgi:hypothetical protein